MKRLFSIILSIAVGVCAIGAGNPEGVSDFSGCAAFAEVFSADTTAPTSTAADATVAASSATNATVAASSATNATVAASPVANATVAASTVANATVAASTAANATVAVSTAANAAVAARSAVNVTVAARSAANAAVAARSSAGNAAAVSGEITAENITLEYTEIEYNGKPQSPKITVTIGETVLTAGTDFAVEYPADCINIGEKTVTVSGRGNCTGLVKLNYIIKPLNCTNSELVTVEAGDCYYSGLPQYPEVTVKVGDVVVPESEYTLSLSDNVEVSVGNGAKCVVKFRGNLTGERTVFFRVLRRVREDLEIDLTANAGQSFSIDLTPLKPAGAIFGNHVFLSSDFSPYNQPKIAFNVLTFTLNPNLKRSTMVAIPLTNIPNIEDYWLEFYIEVTDKEIPVLSLNPIVKEFDGKPVSADALSENGSRATVNGEEISGKWEFTTPAPTMPCNKEIVVVKFTPDNEDYSYAYGLVQTTVSRVKVEDFKVTAKSKKLDLGEYLHLTVSGIPKDFDGTLSITGAEDDEFTVIQETEDEKGRVYLIEFAEENALHPLKITLGGSARYAPCTADLEVTVGNPPELNVDSPTTEAQLKEMIEQAEAKSVLKTYKLTSVSAELLRMAAAKQLTIEVKANDSLTLVLEPARIKEISALNLTISPAVIPQVLMDRLGDEQVLSFTSFAKCEGGISVKAAVKSELNLPLACLFLYNTNGELEHIKSVPISGSTVKFEMPSSGKFAITASRLSHIPYDLNNDCEITLNDVVLSLDFFLQLVGQPSAEQTAAFDFNGDGKITLDDTVFLLDYYLAL